MLTTRILTYIASELLRHKFIRNAGHSEKLQHIVSRYKNWLTRRKTHAKDPHTLKEIR